MTGFTIIPEALAVMKYKCVWKQTNVYKRKEHLYVNGGGGFIRLKESGDTSHPDWRWEEIEGIKGIKKKPKSGAYIEVKSEAK